MTKSTPLQNSKTELQCELQQYAELWQSLKAHNLIMSILMQENFTNTFNMVPYYANVLM